MIKNPHRHHYHHHRHRHHTQPIAAPDQESTTNPTSGTIKRILLSLVIAVLKIFLSIWFLQNQMQTSSSTPKQPMERQQRFEWTKTTMFVASTKSKIQWKPEIIVYDSLKKLTCDVSDRTCVFIFFFPQRKTKCNTTTSAKKITHHHHHSCSLQTKL